jgi:hypothetical protein
MLTKTTIALVAALTLGVASAALAANENDGPNGGYRLFGPGGGATQGINAADHAQAAGVCARKYKSYDPTTMTYLGKDGVRHPCGA